MANSWGELGWDIGAWGSQNDTTASLSSFELISLQGQAQFVPTDGWGRSTWGTLSWNASFANATINLSGIELTFTLGDETAAGEINSGWGRLTWGENAWNITGDVLLTGIELTTSLGDESIQIDVAPIPTGIELITELNSVTEIITVDTFPTGIELTTALGTVDAEPDASVTGIELTSATGTLLGYNRQGWGRFYWGEEVWGDNGIWVTASVTGQELIITQGNEDIDVSVTAEVSSVANVGWGVVGWGEQGWNASQENIAMTINEGEVDPSPDATVTGIGMTCDLAVGTVIIGTANVDVTGTELTMTLASVEAEAITFADVTGIALTLDLGTAFGGANVDVDITGNILTIAQNSISVQSWTKINTGTVVTWTEIDTAA